METHALHTKQKKKTHFEIQYWNEVKYKITCTVKEVLSVLDERFPNTTTGCNAFRCKKDIADAR